MFSDESRFCLRFTDGRSRVWRCRGERYDRPTVQEHDSYRGGSDHDLWDLVCGKQWISKTIVSIQMSGIFVGVVLAGQIVNTLGRRNVLLVAVSLHPVLNLICAFSVSWQMYAALRFLTALSFGCFAAGSMPHVLEFLGHKHRPLPGALPLWNLGVCGLSLFAYLCPNWSYLYIGVAALSTPFVLGWFFVPESLRWLTVKGRVEEAESVLEQIARYNKRPKPADARARLEQVARGELAHRAILKTYTYIDTVRDWKMLKTTLCSSFIWFSCSMMYNGVSFGVSSLSGNMYLNMFLLSIGGILVEPTTYWTNNKFGRKRSVFGFFLLSGVAMVTTLGVNLGVTMSNKGTIITGLALFGQMGLTCGWSAMLVYTNELYPTVIRTLGFGVCQTVSRIGGIVAPLVLLMVDRFSWKIVMGLVAVFYTPGSWFREI